MKKVIRIEIEQKEIEQLVLEAALRKYAAELPEATNIKPMIKWRSWCENLTGPVKVLVEVKLPLEDES